MSGLMQSVGGLVGAGVKGFLDMAEGYMHMGDVDDEDAARLGIQGEASDTPRSSISSPSNPIPVTGHSSSSTPLSIPDGLATTLTSTNSASSSATSASSVATASTAPSHLSIAQARLVEIQDVPSGWIHLQSTYLDGNGGERKVRSFGLRCLGDQEVRVEVGSDLGGQVAFWKGDDERELSSAASYSSTSSASNSSGTPSLILTLQPLSITTIYLAFSPSRTSLTPPAPISPLMSDGDGGFTPRLQPALTRQDESADLSPVPPLTSVSSQDSANSNPSGSENDHSGSISGGSSQSVAGSFRGPSSLSNNRRPEPVHRAFSVHGSISIRASTAPPIGAMTSTASSVQYLSLPFFATVCKSLFTAALIDPNSELVTGSQQMSGQMIIDFGSDSIVGEEYHRDILLVNRSEIELVWMTAVVNARYKDAAWFSLRDLDSENVFGVDTSTQPVPLPALSSRHLRLELRVKEPVPDFSFDFVISNVNQAGNLVTCRAVGSGQPEASDQSLKILSGTTLDFGQITDGVWSKKLITCKNAGDRPLDVKFSASPGVDVVFRLAGVAGDDIDEDIPLERIRAGSQRRAPNEHLALSRTSTRDTRGRTGASPLRSRNPSPNSSAGRGTSASADGFMPSHHLHLSSQLARLESASATGSGRSLLGDHESVVSSGPSGLRDPSQPPSRPLSRVASRSSSYKYEYSHTDGTESDEDDHEPPFFSGGSVGVASDAKHLDTSIPASLPAGRADTSTELITDRAIPNQIEELAMRPGTEYRLFVLHRPARDTVNPPEVAALLRKSNFKIYLDSQPSSTRSSSATTSSSSSPLVTRHTLHGTAESCTSLIHLESGSRVDFGEITVGASKSTAIRIRNMSQLSAKIEIAAISKVLSTNRNVIVIPPGEVVEEKLEFFPRRINERYEKQVFVRNLLNRSNDQLIEIRSRNVDVNNVTLHSHLYRILTPNGANFLDFGSVVINSPSIRTLLFENLTNASLILLLMASQPEDVELYVKVDDSEQSGTDLAQHRSPVGNLERVTSPQSGDLKERFIETLRELSSKSTTTAASSKSKPTGKPKEKKHHAHGHASGHSNSTAHGSDKSSKSHGKNDAEGAKLSVGASVAAALKKGGRGRAVLLYGNAVMFKDRSLLDQHEHLDLAAGPPISAHRTSPRSKKSALLDSIESGDKSKLSGQHPKIPKLDFAASAKALGTVGKDGKDSKTSAAQVATDSHAVTSPTTAATASPSESVASTFSAAPVPIPTTSSTLISAINRRKTASHPTASSPLSLTSSPASRSPDDPLPTLTTVMQSLKPSGGPPTPDGGKSPALTGKRAEPKSEMFSANDISKLTIDELLVAFEQHDANRSKTPAGSSGSTPSLEEEEAFVRRTISLRKEIQNHISSGRLVPARQLSVPPRSSRQLIVLLTPNGSIRPHISTRPKRADSRIFIRLNEFDRSFLSSTSEHLSNMDLPVRDLIIRSSCVRSMLEVQQSSINFGNCEKGEVKSKTIVIQNKSDCVGLFRLRTSGSIASGDLKLGLGRYGVISAFGRKEVENFSFTPSLVGNYQETIVVENVLDSFQDQSVSVKANVRRQPTFSVEPAAIDFGSLDLAALAAKSQNSGNDKTASLLPKPLNITLTNSSKVERTFIVEAVCNETSFLQVSLRKDDSDAGTALSVAEEEEAEGMLQKLKIARRKGKPDKIAKYEARLTELGVKFPPTTAVEPLESDAESVGGEIDALQNGVDGIELKDPQDDDVLKSEGKGLDSSLPLNATSTASSPTTPIKPCVTSLSLILGPSQKLKILVEAIQRAETGQNHVASDLAGTIKVFEKKNTDETVVLALTAAQPQAVGSVVEATPVEASTEPTRAEREPATTTDWMLICIDPLHLALMRHCLELTLLCPVSPTAFCVGSTLFLPSDSPYYTPFREHFPPFQFATESPSLIASERQSPPSVPPPGLILADGYSRQIPGNTHAEANALTNFRTRYAQLLSESSLPPIEEVLKDVECYATMEPCSIRTSGGPSCALELVRANVKTVYLGVEEPPDFVQCEGVRILEDGGVRVRRVLGLEEECLKAARRGRDDVTSA